MDVAQAKALLDKYIDTLVANKAAERRIRNTRWIIGHILQKCEDLQIGEVNPKVLRMVTLHYMGVDISDPSKSYGQGMVRAAVARYWSFCNTGEATSPSVLYPLGAPDRFREVFCSFCDFLDTRDYAISTKRTQKEIAMAALRFFEQEGIEDLGQLEPEDYRRFVTAKFSKLKASRAQDSCKCKVFFDWLNAAGIVGFSSYDAFPYGFGRQTKGKHISSHYSADEIRATFAAVDRSTRKGKRDYLVLCLTGLLGMRIGDVVDLRLGDIDWATGKISKAQCKTGRVLTLPLIEPVEEALRDYLDNGRPECTDDHVIIRLTAPYTGYVSVGTFTAMVTEHMLNAGVDISGRHHGTHCLRHSTAGGLLTEGASVPEVSEILGHSSSQSTKHYLALDAQRMRLLGLEVPDVRR